MREFLNRLTDLLTWKTGAEIAAKGIVGFGTFVLGLCARWVWAAAKARYASWKANALWRKMLGGRITIVTAIFEHPTTREFEKSGLMGVGDAWALAVLESWFKSIRFGHYEIQYAHQVPGEMLNGSNLICVGGPDANSITRDALNRLGVSIYAPRSWHDPGPSFRRQGEGFDFFTVCFVSNPYSSGNTGKWLLFLFGETSGYGTWAAAEAVTIKPVRMGKMGPRGFTAFLRTEVVRERPQQVRLLEFRPLDVISKAEPDIES